MPIYKRCKVCNIEFAVTPSLSEKREYCSVKCRGESQKTLIDKNCSVCGKLFSIKAYRKDTATCSKECGYVAKKIKKTCVVCGNDFHVPKSRISATSCSNECAKTVRAENTKRQVSLICEHCGNTFQEAKSHSDRRRFCSKECISNSEVYKQETSIRLSGDLNPMWKGGIVTHSDGYIYEARENHKFQSNGKYVFQHRLVIEDIMKIQCPEHHFLIEIDGVKYLSPDILVHHIDIDRSNNKQNNLLAVTPWAHQLIHAGQVPYKGTYWPEKTNIFIK